MLTIGACPRPDARSLERSAAGDGWQEARCAFIMSTGRVGTMSLVKILGLSPDVVAYHEPAPRCEVEHKEAYQQLGGSLEGYRPLFAWARAEPIRAARTEGLLYAEHGYWTPFTDLIAEMLPNARFINPVRHPGEFIRSGMRRGWFAGHVCDPIRPVPAPGTPAAEAWEGWSRFEKVVWVWEMISSHLLSCQRRYGPDRWRVLRFEEWTRPGFRGWGDLFEWLGVRAPSETQIVQAVRKPENTQNRGEFPKYPDWSDEQKDQLRRIAGRTMAQLGYE